MYVGFMHNYRKPPKLVELIAMASKYHNMDIIYLRPMDVDIERNVVNGRVLVNNKWVEKETEIPSFIDISPYCFKRKNKDVTDYLKEKTFLSDNRDNVLTKEKLQELLKEDPGYSHLVIPTEKVSEMKDLTNFLDRYSTIVLKPISGIQGKGVYILRKERNYYELGHYTETIKLNKKGLINFYNESIKPRRYIMQKNISSRTLQGDPFDCRVHVEKNQEGKWVSAKNYIRIGIGQTVISNVNQGGGIADPGQFLKANFGEAGEEINEMLNQLAITLPYKIEELRETHIMSLGIDVGIDADGKLYLFEVNDGPATDKIKAEVAVHRSNYYKFVLENKLHKILPVYNKEAMGTEINHYKKEVALFEKEIMLLKKEISLLHKEKHLVEQENN